MTGNEWEPRLTEEDARRGVQPAPFTKDEWAHLERASRAANRNTEGREILEVECPNCNLLMYVELVKGKNVIAPHLCLECWGVLTETTNAAIKAARQRNTK